MKRCFPKFYIQLICMPHLRTLISLFWQCSNGFLFPFLLRYSSFESFLSYFPGPKKPKIIVCTFSIHPISYGALNYCWPKNLRKYQLVMALNYCKMQVVRCKFKKKSTYVFPRIVSALE